jgi:tetratricopeptide (TPR) repeat protein
VLTLRALLSVPVPGGTSGDTDPVVHETLTLLGSGPPVTRQYGLVVPENKVRQEGGAPVLDTIEDVTLVPDEPVPTLDDPLLAGSAGPLEPALRAWRERDIGAGLDAYLTLVIADQSLAAQDDKGILAAARRTFEPRFQKNPDDEEARYYVGVLEYLDGRLLEADTTLKPFRDGSALIGDRVKPIFRKIDAVKAAEEARRLAAEEEARRLEAERQARLAQAQAASIAASLSKTSGGGKADASGTEALHNEAYDLYKKGQLDQAIQKFEAAIQIKADEPKFHYYMGLALTDKGLAGDMASFDRAIEAFNKVIALDQGSKLAKDAEVMIRDIVAAKTSLQR